MLRPMIQILLIIYFPLANSYARAECSLLGPDSLIHLVSTEDQLYGQASRAETKYG